MINSSFSLVRICHLDRLLAPPSGRTGSRSCRNSLANRKLPFARRKKTTQTTSPPDGVNNNDWSAAALAIISVSPTPVAAEQLQRGDKRSAPWALFSSATDVAANRRRLPLDTSPATLAIPVGGDQHSKSGQEECCFYSFFICAFFFPSGVVF